MVQLPKGWVRTDLGSIVDYGKTIKADLEKVSADSWVLELEDIEKNSSKLLKRCSFDERLPKSSKNSFDKGDVLYGKLRPYLNKMLIAPEDGICTTEIVPLKTNSELFESRFLFYWLKGRQFGDYVNTVSYGVNMPRLGTKDGKKAPMVVAPLPEQKRIVEKLDEALAQVGTIKARLDGIPDLLKRFRQSVLASAVSGKLGNKQEVAPKLVELSKTGVEVKTGPFGSALHKSDYIEGGISVINPMHINDGVIQPASQMSITKAKFDSLSAWHLKNGDVVVGRRGEMGRAAVIRTVEENPLLCGTGSMILRGNERLLSDYLCYAIRSPLAVSYFNNASVGSTMVNLNQKVIKSLEIYVPSIKEQKEIVRLVDQYFAFAETIEAQVKKAQAKVDNLTQSILAKAFRGELVPQDPNDESADKLLERIAKARTEAEELAKVAKKAEAAKKRTAKA
ncbi:type I restriction enzyme, S subunit [Vibrio crassostreae]|nr:type I restriction enzyme, S subunit [Vibrio crassostreae]CAK2607212.1 type I restriction enzyme, S subunit [Vibrio crassostreae]CAK3226677.1 type I restriction enzyme, S subunit [Vibrio crassostreae]